MQTQLRFSSAPPVPKLRYYQHEAIAGIHESFAEAQSTLVVMATGLGKTMVFVQLAMDWPEGDVLVLAHRDELLRQAQERFTRYGVDTELEQADLKASKRAHIVIASIDTIRSTKRLAKFDPKRFGLIICDECFPAGTLVDGRPIETIREGDFVWSVDHSVGQPRLRRVVRTMRRSCTGLVRLHIGATALECTGNHPIFVRGQGYTSAENIRVGDVLCVWCNRNHGDRGTLESAEDVFEGVSILDLLQSDGGDQSQVRLGAHEGTEPNAQCHHPATCIAQAERDGSLPSGSRGERDRVDRSTAISFGTTALSVGGGACREDLPASRVWVSDVLQDRSGDSGSEARRRARRELAPVADAQSPRPEERGVLVWSRVDRVEVLEPDRDVAVYNLEIEESHTYFANGVLVHNCHHYVGNTYTKPLDYFRDSKRVGFTATPDRGDEQAMGKQWESVAYVRDILDGIEDGYLVPIKARPITDCNVHLDKVKKTAGDLQAGSLDEAMLQAVEPVCKKILELEPDRRGILFFPGVRSAALASERMNQLRPGSAVFISGTTPTDERRRAIEQCRRGERRYLCNCQVATEGFDWAEANLIAMARPTMSRALYAQMAGRGTRVLPGTVEHLDGSERAAERRAAIAASEKPDMMILDFIDAQSKHTLVTPLDILGGKFTEDELKEAKLSAKKKQSQSYDQLALLNEARSQIAHLSTTTTTVTARVGELYDPFSALGMKQGTRAEMSRLNSRFGKEPITPGQLTYLERTLCTKRGMTSAEVAQLSKREASKLITELVNRQKAGKATFKQLAILRDFGWDDTSVSMAQATAAIDFISSVRWNKSRATPADICRAIANAPTERRPPPPKPQPQYEDDLPW